MRIFKSISVFLVSLALCACGSEAPVEFNVTPDGVKSLSKDILSVEVTPQIDGKTNYVEIEFKQDPLFGGQSDWNMAASTSHRLMLALFGKEEVSRVRISFVSPENKNLGWAQIRAKRDDLPANWQELNYQQLFAVTKPVAGTLQVSGWLCDFYKKYGYTVPKSGMPPSCSE